MALFNHSQRRFAQDIPLAPAQEPVASGSPIASPVLDRAVLREILHGRDAHHASSPSTQSRDVSSVTESFYGHAPRDSQRSENGARPSRSIETVERATAAHDHARAFRSGFLRGGSGE